LTRRNNLTGRCWVILRRSDGDAEVVMLVPKTQKVSHLGSPLCVAKEGAKLPRLANLLK
jgi:hypothetical protein